MSKEYIKQHIVPACYLANFGANGNKGRKSKIYYYIRDKGISGCGCAGDFPVERNFYDIPELGENEKILELFFQKIEPDYSELLKEFIRSISFDTNTRNGLCVDFPLNKRDELNAQFSVQIQRTRSLGKHFKHIYTQLKSAKLNYNIPGYGEDDFRRLQNQQILSFDLANFYANMFNDRKWIVLVNHTELPFLTSDNPVISIDRGNNEHFAAASDDLTYYIPISPLFAIEMYPKSIQRNDLSYFDIYDTNQIVYYNSQIVQKCAIVLFSNKNFGSIKMFKTGELSRKENEWN